MAGLRGNSPKRPAGPGASSTTAKASTIPQQQSKSVESTGVIKTVFIQVLELYMTMNVTCNGRTSDKLAKINDIVCRRTDPTRNVVNWQAEIRSLAKPQQKKGQGPKSKVRKLFNQQFVIQGDPEVGTFRTARAWIPTCTLHVWWNEAEDKPSQVYAEFFSPPGSNLSPEIQNAIRTGTLPGFQNKNITLHTDSNANVAASRIVPPATRLGRESLQTAPDQAPPEQTGEPQGARSQRARSPKWQAFTIDKKQLTGRVMNTILVIDHNVSGSGTCAPTWEFVVEISALTQKDSVPWTREELANLLSALKGRDNMPIAKLKDLPEVFKTSNDQEKELIAEQMNIPTKYRRSLYEGTIEIVIDSKNILYTKPELAKQMSEEITNGYITRHDRDSEYWRTGYWRQGLLGSPVQLVQANDRLVFKLDNSRSNFFFIPLG